jgi:predicted ATPase
VERRTHSKRGTDWKHLAIDPFKLFDGIAQLQAELAFLEAEALSEAEAHELAEALYGLPLALRLAAGFLAEKYTAAQFIGQLHKTSLKLESAYPDGQHRDPRRLTLHGAFNISFQLLSPKQQIAFAALSYAAPSGFGLNLGTVWTGREGLPRVIGASATPGAGG